MEKATARALLGLCVAIVLMSSAAQAAPNPKSSTRRRFEFFSQGRRGKGCLCAKKIPHQPTESLFVLVIPLRAGIGDQGQRGARNGQRQCCALTRIARNSRIISPLSPTR